jgi:hypothetical protein
VIGIDIGKTIFHLIGLDRRGAIVFKTKLSRSQLESRLANIPPCLIGMEACVGAHHLSRQLIAPGHDARLMPAKYVKAFLKGNKNDFRDAEAIAEAVQRKSRFVRAFLSKEAPMTSSADEMPKGFDDSLPDVLKRIRTRPLFVMSLDVRPLQIIGATPGAFRRIGVVPGGSFEGDRLSGKVLEGGSDWQTLRKDGAVTLNVRLVLRTHDAALICMTYQGLRHGPADIIERIEKGEVVDPASYYFRINPLFETAAEKYD